MAQEYVLRPKPLHLTKHFQCDNPTSGQHGNTVLTIPPLVNLEKRG